MNVGLRTFMSALLPSPRTPFWLTPHTATRRESSSSASECVPPRASCAQGGDDHGGTYDSGSAKADRRTQMQASRSGTDLHGALRGHCPCILSLLAQPVGC